MIVVDSSVLVAALVDDRAPGAAAREALEQDPVWCAPLHWKVEVCSALRGLCLGGKLPGRRAQLALEWINLATMEEVDIGPLLPAMWALRNEITAYDAAYVALAASRDVTLVTADAPLARAAVGHCRVHLVMGTSKS